MQKKISSLVLCLIFFSLSINTFLGCSSNNDDYTMPSHLTESDEKTQARFITEKEELGFMTLGEPLKVQLDELEKIIIDYGRMPNFDNTDEIVKKTFDAAIEILEQYVPKNASEFEKVHIIHDYLISKIYYDVDLYNEYLTGGNVSNDHESFLASGVLLNKKGVCDGITRAFNLLCGIEGIKSYRIVGAFSEGVDTSLHAWNKVKVDGEWFNVDATMDNVTITLSSTEEIIACHHGYFLLSDKSFIEPKLGKHTFGSSLVNPVDYPALRDYNALNNFLQPDESLTGEKMEIKTQEELNGLLEKVNKANKKVKRLEVKLNFEKYSNSDAVSLSAYSRELFEAYKKIKNCYFSFDLASKTYPYIMYPNGVFLLLFYK